MPSIPASTILGAVRKEPQSTPRRKPTRQTRLARASVLTSRLRAGYGERRPRLRGVEFPPAGVVIGDGGLATELERRGHDLSGPLWSARLLADDPDAIRTVHAAYFAAGARIATTASYQASVAGFVRHGWTAAEAAELLRRSVRLALEARADLPEPDGRWVAASVGPYGAALADGSEYRGRYGLSVAQLIDWHRPRFEILADAGADLIACETVPDLIEAEALVRLVGETGVRAWLSYTIEGERTRAGQPLAEAFALAEAPGIVAVGVNCCDPDDVPAAIKAARTVTDRPIVVYPNSGELWTGTWSLRVRFTAEAARSWVAAGAWIIGGCCCVGPGQITFWNSPEVFWRKSCADVYPMSGDWVVSHAIEVAWGKTDAQAHGVRPRGRSFGCLRRPPRRYAGVQRDGRDATRGPAGLRNRRDSGGLALAERATEGRRDRGRPRPCCRGETAPVPELGRVAVPGLGC